MIDWVDCPLTVKKQCEHLGLARSVAYYRSPEIQPSKEEIDIKNAIDRIHYQEPAYGARRIKNELRKFGFKNIGRRRVKRYMREMDIVAFYPGPNLSKRAKKAKIHPYLLRNLEIDRPNQVWSIDITYIGTPNGFVYLTAIIDWFSRYIVGYTISNTLQADTVTRTVEEAISKHGKPEIINSDQGSQFTSDAYINLIKNYDDIRISMDGRGRATDNIMIERFFRSFKWERLYLMCPENVHEVREMTAEYMHTYNYVRGHQSHKYLTPFEVYHGALTKVA
jgi:putative transposase